eukprot:365864-Chlamydomonas_euryale.AAC.4
MKRGGQRVWQHQHRARNSNNVGREFKRGGFQKQSAPSPVLTEPQDQGQAEHLPDGARGQ